MVEQAPRQHKGKAVPANLRPYIEALGAECAERFFLTLGGSQVYVPATRTNGERGILFDAVGDAELILALAEALDVAGIGGYVKVPIARKWLAETMSRRGLSDNEIARTIRADVATVRRWLRPPEKKAA
jgi:hypothetical protein